MPFKGFTGYLVAGAMLFSCNVAAANPDATRQQELLHLLKQDCGSCHGMTLQGGLGPDLLAPRMAQLPKQYLVTVIAKGRPGTPMPPWENLLSDGDIAWLAEQLQKGVR